MMQTEEYRAKLAEYDKVRGDLNASIMWVEENYPPTMTLTCRCGHSKPKVIQLNWDEVRQELDRHGEVRTEFVASACEVCEPDTETED